MPTTADTSSSIRLRRRMVLWLTGACALLTGASYAVAWYRFGAQCTGANAGLAMAESALLLPLPFLVLLIPVHSRAGSILQLIGAVLMLLTVVSSCLLCAQPVTPLAMLTYIVASCYVALAAIAIYALLWILTFMVNRYIMK
ncbi:MAG: hypothetical protein IJ943_07280 [Akkermansia sp.]|nr:hypothetical protein [Akkermansia sp.]